MTRAAISILGMCCCGGSLIARLLKKCGLYLSAETDLGAATDDAFENTEFRILNDELLSELQG